MKNPFKPPSIKGEYHNAWLFISSILILQLLTGCYKAYIPTSHNIPLFQQAKEARVSAAISSQDYIGYELQSAYSPTKKVGIMLNGYYEGNRNRYNERRIFAEAGSGYFLPVGKYGVFEAYGLMGWGNVRTLGQRYSDASVQYMKISAQPSFGFTFKAFDAALSTKWAGLYYFKLNYPYPWYGGLGITNSRNFSILFEPSAMIRVGWKHIKAQIQLGLILNLSDPGWEQQGLYIGFGVCGIITDKYRKLN